MSVSLLVADITTYAPVSKKEIKAVVKSAEKKLEKKETKLLTKALGTPNQKLSRTLHTIKPHLMNIAESVKQHFFPDIEGVVRQSTLYDGFTGTMQDRTVIPVTLGGAPSGICSVMFTPTANPSIACWSSNSAGNAGGGQTVGLNAKLPEDSTFTQCIVVPANELLEGGGNLFIQTEVQSPDRNMFQEVRMHTCVISVSTAAVSMLDQGFILCGTMPNPIRDNSQPDSVEYQYGQIQYTVGDLAALPGVVTIPFSQLVQTGGARAAMHKLSPRADDYVPVIDFVNPPPQSKVRKNENIPTKRRFDRKTRTMVGNPPNSDTILVQGTDFMVPFIVICNTGGSTPSFEVTVSRCWEGIQVYDSLMSGGLSLPGAGSSAPTRNQTITKQLNDIAKHNPLVPNPSMKLSVDSIVGGLLHAGKSAAQFAMSPAGQTALMTFAEIAGGLILA